MQRGRPPRRAQRDHLPTEAVLDAARELDRLPAAAAVALMLDEDERMLAAVRAAAPEIAAAVELVAGRLAAGGRLVYVGAGTSGRLGVLDASECPPTFSTPPELVQGIIAGGPDALRRAIEGAEDDREAAVADLVARELSARDCVVGITAGGTTPYVHAALDHARELGAATVFVSCVPKELVSDRADVSIRVVTGPEVVAGSTRLKAGSATKLVLNALSTLSMARLGKVHEGWMVDVDARANAKLMQRATTIVQRVTGLTRFLAEELLQRADGQAKTAIAMHGLDCSPAEAREALSRAQGSLRRALG